MCSDWLLINQSGGAFGFEHALRSGQDLAIYGCRPFLLGRSCPVNTLTVISYQLYTRSLGSSYVFHSSRSTMPQDAVPLPKRSNVKPTCCSSGGCAGSACQDPQGGTELEPRSSIIWPIESRIDAEPVCEAATLLREKCCKHDTKPERQLVSGDMVRDM